MAFKLFCFESYFKTMNKMLINSIKWRHSSLKSIKRFFCSQIIKINDSLNKSENHFNKSEENSDKSLSEKQKNEIEKVVESEYMDKVWELNHRYSHNKEYNKLTDVYREAHKPFDAKIEAMTCPEKWTFERFKEGFGKWIQYREENQNKYVAKRHAILGPDLAVANFVVERGGRVRFKHSPDVWATHLNHFPDKYDPRYRVIGVDASHTKLRFEGIDNFLELNSLEVLDLSDNKLDDWSCDQIARIFRNSKLLSLDLSNNLLITQRGIETLHKVRSLRSLKINGTEAANYPFLELLILSFNDLVPNCHIVYN